MRGPLGKLVVAGKKGAYSGNIQRDMLRSIQKLQGFQYVHGEVSWLLNKGIPKELDTYIKGFWVLNKHDCKSSSIRLGFKKMIDSFTNHLRRHFNP